jgi:hypothetical protein
VKVATQAITFWVLGSSLFQSIGFIVLQTPVFLTIALAIRHWWRPDWKKFAGVVLVGGYLWGV